MRSALRREVLLLHMRAQRRKRRDASDDVGAVLRGILDHTRDHGGITTEQAAELLYRRPGHLRSAAGNRGLSSARAACIELVHEGHLLFGQDPDTWRVVPGPRS